MDFANFIDFFLILRHQICRTWERTLIHDQIAVHVFRCVHLCLGARVYLKSRCISCARVQGRTYMEVPLLIQFSVDALLLIVGGDKVLISKASKRR